jgi:predicted transcriptional regulator
VVYVPDELFGRVAALAKQRGQTLSVFIRRALEEATRKEEGKGNASSD